MQTLIVVKGDPDTDALYRRAAALAADTYSKAFSAKGINCPPRMAVTLSEDGRIISTAGIRSFGEGFFSQHYFDEPIHEALSRRSGLAIGPQGMLEVGGLTCASPFHAFPTLRAVFDWGRARGIGWGLFTATAEVRRLVARARISPILLGRAEAARVPDRSAWGNYYDHDPWVCAFRDPVQALEQSLPFVETA